MQLRGTFLGWAGPNLVLRDDADLVTLTAAGQPLARLSLRGPVPTWAFGPRGEHVAARSTGDGVSDHIEIQDVSSGTVWVAGSYGRLGALAFSADERWLAVGTTAEVRLFDTVDRHSTRRLRQGADILAFSPDGTLVAALMHSTVHVLTFSQARELMRIDLPAGFNLNRSDPPPMRFSTDGRFLVVALSSHLVVADLEGVRQGTLQVPELLAWAMTADRMVSASPSQVESWDLSNGVRQAVRPQDSVSTVAAVSADLRWLAAAHDNHLSLIGLEPESGPSASELPAAVHSLAFGPEGQLAVGCGNQETVLISPPAP